MKETNKYRYNKSVAAFINVAALIRNKKKRNQVTNSCINCTHRLVIGTKKRKKKEKKDYMHLISASNSCHGTTSAEEIHSDDVTLMN
jgi:hypothetical protein